MADPESIQGGLISINKQKKKNHQLIIYNIQFLNSRGERLLLSPSDREVIFNRLLTTDYLLLLLFSLILIGFQCPLIHTIKLLTDMELLFVWILLSTLEAFFYRRFSILVTSDGNCNSEKAVVVKYILMVFNFTTFISAQCVNF